MANMRSCPYPESALRRTVLRILFVMVLTVACRLWAVVRDDAIPSWVTELEATKAITGIAHGPSRNDLIVTSQPSLVTLESLKGIQSDQAKPFMDTSSSTEQMERARKPLLDILTRAGLHVDEHVMRLLPTWSQVEELYGSNPVIFGKQYCQAFRDAVPQEKRFVGVAGQMNTGTNALYKYLNQNMYLPENNAFGGVLWTIPWYKHVRCSPFPFNIRLQLLPCTVLTQFISGVGFLAIQVYVPITRRALERPPCRDDSRSLFLDEEVRLSTLFGSLDCPLPVG